MKQTSRHPSCVRRMKRPDSMETWNEMILRLFGAVGLLFGFPNKKVIAAPCDVPSRHVSAVLRREELAVEGACFADFSAIARGRLICYGLDVQKMGVYTVRENA